MTLIGEIYIIRNTVNKKVYIGQTHETVRLRFLNHLSAARRGKGYVIGKAMRKHGLDKFYTEVIERREFTDADELTKWANRQETFWVAFYKATNPKYGYNMSIGGNVVRTTKELDETQVIEMFNSGIAAWNIAKMLHVGVPNISRILQKNNILYGIEKQRRQDEKEIIEAYLSGKRTMEISKQFKINKGTVRRILLRNGYELYRDRKNKNSERNPQTLNQSDPRELCA